MLSSQAASGLDSPVLTAALVAAQATAPEHGFRQRDVRFFAELFGNWLESTAGAQAFHNTQVLRCVHALAGVGWATRSGRKPPRWRLTSEGLVELLRRLVHRRDLMRLDEFFLVHHFLAAYGDRLRALAQRGGAMESRLLAVDLDEMLSPETLLERERARVARELARLQIRVEEARMTAQLARRRLARGVPVADVVDEVQSHYPYELNSQRPLNELLSPLPERWQREELTEASERRANGLWGSQVELLRAYDGVLERLLAQP
ncbi:MAG: hypothetical protein OXU20_27295 [Myxococcales bacterium]|nr:hypothetical protein [Myxococcales bacterium]